MLPSWYRPRKPLVTEIIRKVAKRNGVTVAALRGRDRTPFMCDCRREVIAEARLYGYGWCAISRRLNRDHSTIMHLAGVV